MAFCCCDDAVRQERETGDQNSCLTSYCDNSLAIDLLDGSSVILVYLDSTDVIQG